MGYTFHTAPFIQAESVTDVTIQIITLSLGTRVHVIGGLADNAVDELRLVKVGNPVSSNVRFLHVKNFFCCAFLRFFFLMFFF